MGRQRRLAAGRRLRRPQHRAPRVRTIVVCYDGEKTEAEYFVGWRRELSGVGVEVRPVFVDSGGNALHAVEAALVQKGADSEYDEYWCVCDVDDTSQDDLSRARQKAQAEGLALALSCRSFEVWLALHWQKISTAEITSEKEAVALVAKHHKKYSARLKIVPFEILLPRTDDAIANSTWLEHRGHSNPSTDVHKLVERLQAKRRRPRLC